MPSFLTTKTNLSHKPIRIVENQLYDNTNCCESLRLCLNNLMNSCVLIFNGDVVLSTSLLKSIDLTTTSTLYQENDGLCNLDKDVVVNSGQLTNIAFGLKHDKWCEMLYVHDKTALNQLTNTVSSIDYKNKFLFEAVNELIKKCPIKIFENKIKVDKINNLKTYRRTNKV